MLIFVVHHSKSGCLLIDCGWVMVGMVGDEGIQNDGIISIASKLTNKCYNYKYIWMF